VPAADAYRIDSTYLAADQVVEQILDLARKKVDII
jgi:cytidylate kinase